VSTAHAADGAHVPDEPPDVAALLPVIRRIVQSRVGNHPEAEDLVQETLARVLAASERIEPGALEPYAITTARNVISSMWREGDRAARNLHRTHEPGSPESAQDLVVAEEEHVAMAAALARLDARDRDLLLSHEVHGEPTRALAEHHGSTAGAVAAQLSRSRARLRVEYLFALEHVEPRSDRCRPVLLALSSADRRRQRELDVARHLLECDVCARLSEPLLGRTASRDSEVQVPIEGDPDIVQARQAAREMAQRAGFTGASPTLVATAVSEIARNIVRFAHHGSVTIELMARPRAGIRVVARDTGPGIPDVQRALEDGFSTYGGLGLGLPGARRMMDEFAVATEQGRGTTVTMTKWFERGQE
jgi:RNA polymerase sigma factor (sigma-70 family)